MVDLSQLMCNQNVMSAWNELQRKIGFLFIPNHKPCIKNVYPLSDVLWKFGYWSEDQKWKDAVVGYFLHRVPCASLGLSSKKKKKSKDGLGN